MMPPEALPYRLLSGLLEGGDAAGLALTVGHGQWDAVLQQAHTAHAELGSGAEAAG